ncbi:hypothetical protein Mgra_00001092 [Meloidogyne graminicola]|uniref:Uncharacterized protein n=1 Tax=Meloidogyne graminicola TaxID=189291 RepID=A0A8T0A1H2_9BILA|nr:hypothetical protein Mgra_00001092 [Meloidogyne graminicola]
MYESCRLFKTINCLFMYDNKLFKYSSKALIKINNFIQNSYGPYCYTSSSNTDPFCCCYGDGCNSRLMPPYCEALGIWDSWGDWSSCPSISSSNSLLNIRRRLRTCSPFGNCHPMAQFQCNGNYSEVSPCITNTTTTTNTTTNNSNIQTTTTPSTINSGVGGPIVVDMLQSAKVIASGALSTGLIQSMQVNSSTG